MIPTVIQMRKLRVRKIKYFGQDHVASRWHSEGFNPVQRSAASLCYGAELHQAADGSAVGAGRLQPEKVDSLSHVTGVGLPGPS